MPIRIFAVIFAFALLVMSVVGALLVWQGYFVEEKEALAEIEEMKAGSAPLADPGLRLFERAMNLIREGDLIASREALFELVRVYKDSSRFLEAKRVIGEINMDLLLNTEPHFGKKDYIVQRGDSVGAIARREGCTIDYLMRVNGLISSRSLHPGDKLTVCPLEFSGVVTRGEERFTLLRKGRYFKEYPVSRVVLAPGTPASFETSVKAKSSWVDGKTVVTTDARYNGGEKWVQLERRGVVMMQEKPPVAVAAGSSTPKSTEESTAGEQPGIFLAREDIEELYSILPTGTKITILR